MKKRQTVTLIIRRPGRVFGTKEMLTEEQRVLVKGNVCVDGHWYKPTLMDDGKYHVTVLPLVVDAAIGHRSSRMLRGTGMAVAVGMVGSSILLGTHGGKRV